MKKFVLLMLFVVTPLFGYCLDATDVTQKAKDFIAANYPNKHLDNYRQPKTVYIADEDVWIVHFADKMELPRDDFDFMIKVDGKTGQALGLLGGANKTKYYPYLKD